LCYILVGLDTHRSVGRRVCVLYGLGGIKLVGVCGSVHHIFLCHSLTGHFISLETSDPLMLMYQPEGHPLHAAQVAMNRCPAKESKNDACTLHKMVVKHS
jgi:hypothetical protein